MDKLFYNYIFVLFKLNNELTALTDNGAITGLEAREDGVYITYVPTEGADAVVKKLGNSKKCISITCLLRHQYGGTWENKSFTLTINYNKDGDAISASLSAGASGNFGNSNPYQLTVSSCRIQ